MKTLIKNIKEIVGTSEETTPQIKRNITMNQLSNIKDGWIMLENDIISDFGNMQDWKGIEDWNNIRILDANSGIVMPTWCDSHTHIVYAGSREQEFA